MPEVEPEGGEWTRVCGLEDVPAQGMGAVSFAIPGGEFTIVEDLFVRHQFPRELITQFIGVDLRGVAVGLEGRHQARQRPEQHDDN